MTVKNNFLIFCQNVKALRLSNHLTKKQMAHIMGISPKTLNKIEALELPKITVDKLDRLINHFHRSVEEICQIPFSQWPFKEAE